MKFQFPKCNLILYVSSLWIILGQSNLASQETIYDRSAIASLKVNRKDSLRSFEIYYYNSTRPVITVPYVEGVIDGQCLVYDTSGIILEIISTSDGNIDGYYRLNNTKGIPIMEGYYLGSDTNMKGSQISYYPARYVYYDSDSGFSSEVKYEPYKIGEWKYYDENGRLMRKENYDSTGRMKLAVFFNSTGRVIEEGFDNSFSPFDSTYRLNYKVNEKGWACIINGCGYDTLYYDRDCKKVKTIFPYKNGVLEGIVCYYSFDGMLINRVEYIGGKPKE